MRIVAALIFLLGAVGAWGECGGTKPQQVACFVADDAANPPTQNRTVLVGDSYIKLYEDAAADFAPTYIIRRGVSGAQTVDLYTYRQELILTHAPLRVIMSIGQNDIHNGRTPAQVLQTIQDLVAAIHAQLPTTEIVILSIPPSPIRSCQHASPDPGCATNSYPDEFNELPLQEAANALLSAYADTSSLIDYVDVSTVLFSSYPALQMSYYSIDELHLKVAGGGYDAWSTILSPIVSAALPAEGIVAVDDTLVGQLCSDGLVYVGECPPSTETYYIDSVSGSDSATGLSPALAWRNLSKINTITRVGADVCLMDGSDWTLTSQLTITHRGTETDPAVIKGCYEDGGVPTEYQNGSGSGRGAKPIVRGTITATCVQNYNCTTWVNSTSLLHFRGTDLRFQYASVFGAPGTGVTVGNTDSSTTINVRRVVIKEVDFSHIGKQAVAITRGTQEAAVKGGSITMASLCQEHSPSTCPIWGSALTVAMVPPQARVLVEDVDCYNTAGECFVTTGNVGINTTHVVFRGNRASDNHSTSYYADMARDVVFESNIGVGPSTAFTARRPTAAAPFGGGVRASVEILGQSTERVLVRNHLSTNSEDYGAASVVFPTPAAQGRTTAITVIGSTFVSTDGPRELGILRNNVQYWLRSSVAYSTALSAANKCIWSTTLSGDFRFGYNLWNVAPSDSRCRGTGDKVGDPQFPLSYSAFDGLTHQNMPTFASITPPASSPLKGAGDPTLTAATCIQDLASWGTWIFTQMEYPYTPTPSEWVLCLPRDAMGNPRSATAPTIGAME